MTGRIVLLTILTLLIVPALSGCTNEVYSVLAGYPVTYSTTNSAYQCTLARLDSPDYCYCAMVVNSQQWAGVSSMIPEKWISVITQGRPSGDQWVSEYQVSYTINGQDWKFVDDGRIFLGNFDRNTRIRRDFIKPVIARGIRIHPTKWVDHISFRFDAIFERL